jgi:histidyl-tRNA synthetase
LYEACGGETPATDADVYIAAFGEGTLERVFVLAEELRDKVTGIRVELNLGGGSFKSQMKRADKSGAEFALILGEQELADGCIGIKPLRSTGEQISVALDELAETLARQLR